MVTGVPSDVAEPDVSGDSARSFSDASRCVSSPDVDGRTAAVPPQPQPAMLLSRFADALKAMPGTPHHPAPSVPPAACERPKPPGSASL